MSDGVKAGRAPQIFLPGRTVFPLQCCTALPHLLYCCQYPTLPTLYVAVVQDTSIPGDLATDTGIALANMTLAAWAKGVGSCIMGAINKPALTRLLGIEEPQKLALMVAFGYPAHKAGFVPLTEQTGVKYYLDENRDYCVPKRSREEIARYL